MNLNSEGLGLSLSNYPWSLSNCIGTLLYQFQCSVFPNLNLDLLSLHFLSTSRVNTNAYVHVKPKRMFCKNIKIILEHTKTQKLHWKEWWYWPVYSGTHVYVVHSLVHHLLSSKQPYSMNIVVFCINIHISENLVLFIKCFFFIVYMPKT